MFHETNWGKLSKAYEAQLQDEIEAVEIRRQRGRAVKAGEPNVLKVIGIVMFIGAALVALFTA